MADVVDNVSNGHTRKCPYCPETRTDFQLEVAIALINGHVRRDHGDQA